MSEKISYKKVDEMNHFEKIYDLIKRKYSNDTEMNDYDEESVQIIFKRSQLTHFDLNYFFIYHKLDKEKLLKEWRVQSLSNKNVIVLLWIWKIPKETKILTLDISTSAIHIQGIIDKGTPILTLERIQYTIDSLIEEQKKKGV